MKGIKMRTESAMSKAYNRTLETNNEKKDLWARIQDNQVKKEQLLNSIMADGKVTLKEAQMLGLAQEYDVSTQEGKDAFLLAYERVEELKVRLNNTVDNKPPQFGLEE